MGLGSYFKAKRPGKQEQDAQQSQITEKATSRVQSHRSSHPLHPDSRVASSRVSLAPSQRSTRSSFVDDIKHEVMVNYLYQQQCSHLWVSDGSGEHEGVLLRKGRNHYLACPPQLASSSFAMACAALNVQVRRFSLGGRITTDKF